MEPKQQSIPVANPWTATPPSGFFARLNHYATLYWKTTLGCEITAAWHRNESLNPIPPPPPPQNPPHSQENP